MTLFRVKAKKYIVSYADLLIRVSIHSTTKISASGVDMHPNPHSTTLIGIICAAHENKENVAIYLTNPLPTPVAIEVHKFLRNQGWNLSTTQIKLLNQNHTPFGTVALYPDGGDDKDDWITFNQSVEDLATAYHETMTVNYPDICRYMRKAVNSLVFPPSKKKKDDLSSDSSSKRNVVPFFTRKTFFHSIRGGSHCCIR